MTLVEAAAAIPTREAPLLAIEGLEVAFETSGGVLRAVNGVDLNLRSGETLAIVGESGSGKSVTSLAVMRLIRPPGRIASGSMRFRFRDGTVRDLATLDESAMRSLRGNEVAMIFQEPMTSLNPAHTVGRQIGEALELHRGQGRRDAFTSAVDLLELVEIPDPRRRAASYPHQLSGGMRQRVMIAMALACKPSLLIADEPTTALDVTVQLQILQLMQRLQRDVGMSILFITHNLGVVAEIADRVAVMYGGRIVEEASVFDLFDHPRHPYTRGLLDSLPQIDRAARVSGRRDKLAAIHGSVVDPRHPPPGCSFAPRCRFVIPACRDAVPAMAQIAPGHGARCIRWADV